MSAWAADSGNYLVDGVSFFAEAVERAREI
jgi:hypothetical protein